MADEASRIVQSNEKTKAWSVVFANLGSALIASSAGRMWLIGIDHWAILWGVIGFFVIKGGIDTLRYLEAES